MTKSKALTAIVALLALPGGALVLPGGALAQEESGFPSAPPPPGEPSGFELPTTKSYDFRNGLKVTLVPYGNVPKVLVRAVTRVGNLNDGEKTYIADLTADMMQQGAGDLDAAGVAALAADMGGELGVSVGFDETRVALDVLSENADEAVALIADVLREPALPESELARLKADMIRNISVARTQPGVQADQAFGALLYPGHPYAGQLPAPEEVEAYTAEDVAQFHAEEFGAARTHLYVIGQLDERQVRRAIRRAFKDWDEGPAPLALDLPEAENAEVVLIDRPGAPQSTIRLGKRVPPVDGSIELEAADTLLGGYFSSRITMNIREDKGYTYSPNSQVSTKYEAANWQQNADIQIESTGPALSEVVAEIARLRSEEPMAAEIEAIRNYMNGIFVIRLASRQGLAGNLAFVNLHDLGTEYLETYVDKVEALEPEDLTAAAERYLDPEAMHLVVVGDTSVTRPQIEALPIYGERLAEDAE